MATSVPAPQNNPPDPQVPGNGASTVTNVNPTEFGRRDPAGFREYTQTRLQNERALTEKYIAEGANPADAREEAVIEAEIAANQQFAPQISAAGAGTVTPATTPLLPQQPQPPGGAVAPVNPATNPQVPQPAPGESRLINTLEDFGDPIPPPLRAPAPVVPDGSLPEEQASPGAESNAPLLPAVAVPVTVNNPPDPTVPAVPGSTVTAVTNLNPGRFRANDPAGFAQFQAYEKERQAYETDRLTKAELARSGRTSLTGRQRSIVNADAAALARAEAIRRFTPQIQAANAAIITTTVVPPTTATRNSAGAVNSATDPAAREFTNTAGGAAIGIRRVPRPEVIQSAGTANAQKQAPVQAQTSQPAAADWRVRLKLAPQSKYLYNADQPGILQPLKVTNGIIFPYTPQITTQYLANYSPYNLTHSNFKGYFYQGSNTSEVKITCPFTAQDTFEANYLLAVIHFFRSATKMFYGATDAFRGAPPPLVFLSGLGEFQFNNHACVIQSFDYTLPADVDYIRADTSNNTGTTLAQKRDRQNLPISSNNTSVNRLQNAGLTPGGIPVLPAPTQLGTASPTYVPTKMDISITLLPMQTRIQVSQQFSMEKFANGNLLKGGFW
jgi:hypothetical protein